MALLGEMTALPGTRIVMSKNNSSVDANGYMYGISFAAQSPWLRNQSIKDNILFGYPYDHSRYQQVTECCALKSDFDILEDGDATEIGVRYVKYPLRLNLRANYFVPKWRNFVRGPKSKVRPKDLHYFCAFLNLSSPELRSREPSTLATSMSLWMIHSVLS